jgi:DNA polymerase III epsilon subunit family exonuclease
MAEQIQIKQDYNKMLIDELEFISIDTETTGLKPDEGHKICEIAAIHFHRKRNKPIGFFRYLINPKRPIPPNTTAINNITDEMVQHAPTFDRIIPAFINFIQSSVLIAFNADFDMYFINKELQSNGYNPLRNPIIDVLKLSKWFLQLNNYKLQNVAKSLNIDMPSNLKAHSAMGDAIMNARIFMNFLDRFKNLGYEYLIDILKIAGDRKAECQEMVMKITDAIFREKKIKIVYFSLNRGKTERIVQPLKLEQRNQDYFLVALCYLRNEERTFALNRIEYLEIIP